MQRSLNTSDYRALLNQNTIHLDSKWVKQTIPVTGSVEATLILSDCIIYHRNKYRSFTVDDQQRYGLLTSLSEIQRNYNISYKRAKKIVRDLHDKNLVNIHQQNFVYNQKFYTPTDKALDIFDQLHFERNNHSNEDKIKVEVPLPIDQSTLSNRQNSYKDKYKDKKNNNHNSQKNYSLLENSKDQNVKTVIFDFKKFNFGKVKCEATVLDYLTVKQSKVISVLTYCYRDSLDIIVFNQMLHRSDLKKEAKNFKQLVTWAYFEATKGQQTIFEDKPNTNACKNGTKTQTVNEIAVESGLSDSQPTSENEVVTISASDNQPVTVLPDLTVADIQSMIVAKQKTPEQIIDSEAEVQSEINNKNPIKVKDDTPIQAQYLLSPPNKLYLLETLSEKGINDAQLIVKTAEDIVTEYPRIVFNDLLDGVIYRLVTLPAKQSQQALMNQAALMEIEAEMISVSDVDNAAEETRHQNCTDDAIKSVQNITSNRIKDEVENVDKINNKRDKNLENEAKTAPKKLEDTAVISHKKVLNHADNIAILKNNIAEKIKVIQSKEPPEILNKNNQKRLINGLNKVGITDKKRIIDTAIDIINEYPDLDLQALMDGVVYRLKKMPEKQKNQSQPHSSLDLKINNIAKSRPVTMLQSKPTETPRRQARSIALQASDITMPTITTYQLRQDWTTKADQDFHTDILPVSQQLALAAMIDYVKRKGVTITIDQEVYEWLYHMASNQGYYYNRAKNFKHWCNIVMRQLMQKRLNKPIGFETWKLMIKSNTLAKAA